MSKKDEINVNVYVEVLVKYKYDYIHISGKTFVQLISQHMHYSLINPDTHYDHSMLRITEEI